MSLPDSQKGEVLLLSAEVGEPDPAIGQKVIRELLWTGNGLWWWIGDALRVSARDGGPWKVPIENFGNNDFWFNHRGDSAETAYIMFGVRMGLEALDSLRSSAGFEKASPRVKMWLSALAGMAVPIGIEVLGLPIGGNTPQPGAWAEAAGPLVCGLLAGGIWELSSFLLDGENWIKGKMLVEKYGDKANVIEKSISQVLDKTTTRMNDGRSRVNMAFDSLSQKMDGWKEKMEEFNAANKSLSVDELWKKILGKRLWNAIGGLHVENEKDDDE